MSLEPPRPRHWLVVCRDGDVIVTVRRDPDYATQFVATCEAFPGRAVVGEGSAEKALYAVVAELDHVREVVPLGERSRAEVIAQRDALWFAAHAYLAVDGSADVYDAGLAIEVRGILRAALDAAG